MMSSAFTVMSGNFLVKLFSETVTECNPRGIDENINGLISPVSLPSRVIAAPGGSLTTEKIRSGILQW